MCENNASMELGEGRIVSWMGVGMMSNWELINLRFPILEKENEVVWLIGTYVEGISERIYRNEQNNINSAEFFGWLNFKYKMANFGSRPNVDDILGLNQIAT